MGRSLKKKKSRNREWYPSGKYLYTVNERDESKYKVRHVDGKPEFTLVEIETDVWSLTGKNSDGLRRRERYNAMNVDVAIEEAAERLGYSSDPFEEDMTIPRVSKRWKDSRKVKEETKSGQYQNAIDAWLDYTEEKGLKRYADLRREHFEQYVQWCEERFNGWTLYHYVGKIRSMILWASRNWRGHFTDFAEGVKIPKPRESEFREDRDALTVEEVLAFLDFLGNHPQGWRIRPAVALCGLAGLSVLEALRMLWEQVDFDRGYVDVAGDVKTKYRERRIPLPAEAWQVLRTSPKDDARLIPTYSAYDHYRAAFYRLFDAWNKARKEAEEPEIPRIVPSDLRDVIQTQAQVEGWSGYVLDRYVGHASRTIRDKHYTKRSEATLIVDMRATVTDRIDARLEKWRAKCQPNGNRVGAEGGE